MTFKPSKEEDKYFAARDAERRSRIRKELEQAAEELHEKQRVAREVDAEDMELVDRIRALGFDGDTARVFDVLPLIHVAWADGTIQARERESIFSILEAREIEPSSEAWLLVETLLEKRPSETFLNETLSILKELVQKREYRGASIVDLCVKIADAAGGFLGIGNKISQEEETLISRIASQLGYTAQMEVVKHFGEE